MIECMQLIDGDDNTLILDIYIYRLNSIYIYICIIWGGPGIWSGICNTLMLAVVGVVIV